MQNEAVIQIAVAYVSSLVMQWLKGKAWFPLLDYDTGKLNAIIASIVAAASGAGIYFSFNRTAGVLTIGGLHGSAIIGAVLHGLLQYLLQHLCYRIAVAPPLAGAIQEKKRNAPPLTSFGRRTYDP